MQKGKKEKSISSKKKVPLQRFRSNAAPKNTTLAAIAVVILILGTLSIYSDNIRDPYLAPRFVFVATFLAVAIYWFMIRLKWVLPIYQPFAKVFLGISLVFIVWSIICTSQSLNINESIFFICRGILFFLSFIIILVLLEQQADKSGILHALTLTSAILAIIGITQYYNVAFTFIPGDLNPIGLSGNRNLYSSLLVLLLPFAFYTLAFGNRIWKLVATTAVTASIFALILGQTRAAWLAFILGIIIFQLYFFIIRKNLPQKMVRNWLWGSIAIASMIVLALGIVILTDDNGKLQAQLKSRLQSLYALNDLDDSNEASRNINERLLVWSGTVDMIQDKPLQGVGPGNWRLAFPQYGSITAIEDQKPVMIDKVRVQPHNVYLHVASETGIPGLLLMLALGATILLAAFGNIKNAHNPQVILLNLLMLCGVIAFAIDMIFSFPSERMEHGIVLALITAFIFASTDKPKATAASKLFLLPASAYFFAALPILVFCITLGHAKWRFDYYLMQILQSQVQGNYTNVLDAVNKGKSKLVTLDPVSDPMEFHAARAYAALGQYSKALEEITMAERFHPNSHRIYNTKAVIYINENRFKEAIEPLQKALQYSPAYLPSLRNLAYSYYRTDQYEASLEVMAKIDMSNDTLLQQMKEDLHRRLANEQQPTSDNN